MLYFSQILEILSIKMTDELIEKSNEISRMLYGLVQSMK